MNAKFRGKRIYNNQWVYGSCYVSETGEKYILEDNYLREDGHHLTCNSDIPIFTIQETVGQWTGLKDKNGKEIYEGDYLKDIGLVSFDKGAIFAGKVLLYNFSMEELEVISNPELLEDK